MCVMSITPFCDPDCMRVDQPTLKVKGHHRAARSSFHSAINVHGEVVVLDSCAEERIPARSYFGVTGMAEESTMAFPAPQSLRASLVYAMAAFCLTAGLAIGYLMRGSQLAVLPAHSAHTAASDAPHPVRAGARP